jgi:hypothetical protein
MHADGWCTENQNHSRIFDKAFQHNVFFYIAKKHGGKVFEVAFYSPAMIELSSRLGAVAGDGR